MQMEAKERGAVSSRDSEFLAREKIFIVQMGKIDEISALWK